MNLYLDEAYWTERYAKHDTGWDTGKITLPLQTYFDQLSNKNLRILIPGAGNGYEFSYLKEKGFQHVFALEYSDIPLQNIQKRHPDIDSHYCIREDFFGHQGEYDLIIEQTFFCAIDRSLRPHYAQQCAHLLATNGKLVGVLFASEFEHENRPPFGGTQEEYTPYFSPHFHFKTFERCYNSIKPRQNNEIFMILEKK